MATVHDVAAYILQKRGPMTAMKLQKLAYYAQAWNLVWEEKPLFDSRIAAWANGPVIYELYRNHRGQFRIDDWPQGDATALADDERETIDAVLEAYGPHTAYELSELTHRERPWLDARAGLRDGERGDSEITPGAMHEFYSGLTR